MYMRLNKFFLCAQINSIRYCLCLFISVPLDAVKYSDTKLIFSTPSLIYSIVTRNHAPPHSLTPNPTLLPPLLLHIPTQTNKTERKKKMPPPSPLSVATNATTRLLKEESSYRTELASQQLRVRELREGHGDDDGEAGNWAFRIRQEVSTVPLLCFFFRGVGAW